MTGHVAPAPPAPPAPAPPVPEESVPPLPSSPRILRGKSTRTVACGESSKKHFLKVPHGENWWSNPRGSAGKQLPLRRIGGPGGIRRRHDAPRQRRPKDRRCSLRRERAPGPLAAPADGRRSGVRRTLQRRKKHAAQCLLERKGLARAAPRRCTRELVVFEAKATDGALLVRPAGYGYAKRSKTERFAWGACRRLSLGAAYPRRRCRLGRHPARLRAPRPDLRRVEARIEERAPGLAQDVDRLRRPRARRHRPQHLADVARVDVVVDHDDVLAEIGTGGALRGERHHLRRVASVPQGPALSASVPVSSRSQSP